MFESLTPLYSLAIGLSALGVFLIKDTLIFIRAPHLFSKNREESFFSQVFFRRTYCIGSNVEEVNDFFKFSNRGLYPGWPEHFLKMISPESKRALPALTGKDFEVTKSAFLSILMKSKTNLTPLPNELPKNMRLSTFFKKWTFGVLTNLMGIDHSREDAFIQEFENWTMGLAALVPIPLFGNQISKAYKSRDRLLEEIRNIHKEEGTFIANLFERLPDDADHICLLLCLAGYETTASMICTICCFLFMSDEELMYQWFNISLKDRDMMKEKLINDASYQKLFIHEMLRWLHPVNGIIRESDGTGSFPKGPVMLDLNAYHRRNGKDRFFPSETSNEHVAFGKGIHSCPGQTMAIRELEFVVQQLLKMDMKIKDVSINMFPIRGFDAFVC